MPLFHSPWKGTILGFLLLPPGDTAVRSTDIHMDVYLYIHVHIQYIHIHTHTYMYVQHLDCVCQASGTLRRPLLCADSPQGHQF